MKKTLMTVLALSVALCSMGISNKNQREGNDSKLMFDFDITTKEAIIIANSPYLGGTYTQETIIVPSLWKIKNPTISEGGSNMDNYKDYLAVEIGEKAFYGAEASNIVFDTDPSYTYETTQFIAVCEKSNIRIIRKQGLANMPNMAGTLTLPASLKALEASAVLLPDITKLVFLGTDSPECMQEGDYNPWMADGVATSKDVEVVVPDGSLASYKKRAGLGNYFTNMHTVSNKYLVVFYDEDGSTVLQNVETVYGTVPEYTETIPTKAEDENYTYTFAGWDKTLSVVRGDDAYKATYKATAKTATAVETPSADTHKTQKTLDNGVLYIIRDGVKYDARGRIVVQ
jgi:hypothetical protein